MFKSILSKIIVLLVTVGIGSQAAAAELKVTWQEPDEYTDIREGFAYTRSGFREHVFTSFEKFLTHRAEKLPEGTLKMTVTNLDLAGETRFNLDEIRIIKRQYIPRIKFSYQLLDKSGKELASGEESLKNMGMSTTYLTKPSEEQFKYEFDMLNTWFRKTFPDAEF
ncbi:DUF3016 domain-containing protein [Catenovulum sp. 2E275]|uniref:DUF3016 domain-containing protein n=1 Tax=Catenovulum sp. 2E275 TaxID=2980497 RepID=UPI0021CF199C|nr:DUF3016 domain-containing protein [Catenovulum sp. 2E275]MCU4676635.1 DUF3016 domain-containing protein [Catenovulum sp. 2E275]